VGGLALARPPQGSHGLEREDGPCLDGERRIALDLDGEGVGVTAELRLDSSALLVTPESPLLGFPGEAEGWCVASQVEVIFGAADRAEGAPLLGVRRGRLDGTLVTREAIGFSIPDEHHQEDVEG
jgi:hypothetical protein